MTLLGKVPQSMIIQTSASHASFRECEDSIAKPVSEKRTRKADKRITRARWVCHHVTAFRLGFGICQQVHESIAY